MKSTDNALSNLFAKLIKRKVKTIEDVPEDLKSDVAAKLKDTKVEIREGESE